MTENILIDPVGLTSAQESIGLQYSSIEVNEDDHGGMVIFLFKSGFYE